ncbi:hypothetical protein NPIL_501631 [Nephila pilipes]|uniref:Uncharacterized protein n=1 Tax=Nephila pilipes TaxID=299642 RepID=A0A8X6N3V7_NEPPI|nr:hypothetical protein NPIL_501631 [Nephila pilipes]
MPSSCTDRELTVALSRYLLIKLSKSASKPLPKRHRNTPYRLWLVYFPDELTRKSTAGHHASSGRITQFPYARYPIWLPRFASQIACLRYRLSASRQAIIFHYKNKATDRVGESHFKNEAMRPHSDKIAFGDQLSGRLVDECIDLRGQKQESNNPQRQVDNQSAKVLSLSVQIFHCFSVEFSGN